MPAPKFQAGRGLCPATSTKVGSPSISKNTRGAIIESGQEPELMATGADKVSREVTSIASTSRAQLRRAINQIETDDVLS